MDCKRDHSLVARVLEEYLRQRARQDLLEQLVEHFLVLVIVLQQRLDLAADRDVRQRQVLQLLHQLIIEELDDGELLLDLVLELGQVFGLDEDHPLLHGELGVLVELLLVEPEEDLLEDGLLADDEDEEEAVVEKDVDLDEPVVVDLEPLLGDEVHEDSLVALVRDPVRDLQDHLLVVQLLQVLLEDLLVLLVLRLLLVQVRLRTTQHVVRRHTPVLHLLEDPRPLLLVVHRAELLHFPLALLLLQHHRLELVRLPLRQVDVLHHRIFEVYLLLQYGLVELVPVAHFLLLLQTIAEQLVAEHLLPAYPLPFLQNQHTRYQPLHLIAHHRNRRKT